MKLLGGKLDGLIPINLPGVVEDRYLVVVEKVAATPLNIRASRGFRQNSHCKSTDNKLTLCILSFE